MVIVLVAEWPSQKGRKNRRRKSLRLFVKLRFHPCISSLFTPGAQRWIKTPLLSPGRTTRISITFNIRRKYKHYIDWYSSTNEGLHHEEHVEMENKIGHIITLDHRDDKSNIIPWCDINLVQRRRLQVLTCQWPFLVFFTEAGWLHR